VILKSSNDNNTDNKNNSNHYNDNNDSSNHNKKVTNERNENKYRKYDLLKFPSNSDYFKSIGDSFFSTNIENENCDLLINDKSSNSNLNVITSNDNNELNEKVAYHSIYNNPKNNPFFNYKRESKENNKPNSSSTDDKMGNGQLKLFIPSASITFHEEENNKLENEHNTNVNTNNNTSTNINMNDNDHNLYERFDQLSTINIDSYPIENEFFSNKSLNQLIRIPSKDIIVDDTIKYDEKMYIDEEEEEENEIENETKYTLNSRSKKISTEKMNNFDLITISNLNNNDHLDLNKHNNKTDKKSVEKINSSESDSTINFNDYIIHPSTNYKNVSNNDIKITNYVKKVNSKELKLH